MNGEYISLETAKKTRRYDILLRRIKILKKENIKRKNIIKKVREYINYYETIRGYFEYEELGYDEYNYDEDLKKELLEILDKENSNG